MEGLLFRRVTGALMKMDAAALERLLAFRQVGTHQEEAGGVLLGRHIVGCQDIVVDEVTCPMPGDLRGPISFHRSHGPHQRIIDARWRDSQGTCQYLGEWHTHPQVRPTPSSVDLADWRRRLATDTFHGASLFFLIVGTSEIRAWEGIRPSLDILPLPLIEPPSRAHSR